MLAGTNRCPGNFFSVYIFSADDGKIDISRKHGVSVISCAVVDELCKFLQILSAANLIRAICVRR